MLNVETKKVIINILLKERLPVSDWYPNVTILFNDVKLPFENVDIMEKELLNFPLDIDEETILRICNKINSVAGEC